MERRLSAVQSKTPAIARGGDRCSLHHSGKILKMQFLLLVCSVLVVAACGQKPTDSVVPFPRVDVEDYDELNTLENSDLVLAFVVFRHGDRTPDIEELDLYPLEDATKIFFPYGPKSLTNKGKQRGYRVGEYLKKRYKEFISPIYLQDEISIRTTDYDRTKMTALTALAALYPPLHAQRWNPALNWQPIPYNTLAYNDDDLLYWYNCPRYLWMRNKVYEMPEVKLKIWSSRQLFEYLSDKTKSTVNKPEDVFYLDNLFQTLKNVGQKLPKWATDAMVSIKEVTKLEFQIEFYNAELIRMAAGVLMNDIRNLTQQAVAGKKVLPKLRLYSAHENNVAAMMAAAKVFQPHQPQYGATFALELRRKRNSGKFVMAAVYSPDAGVTDKILPMEGCDGKLLCDFDAFLTLTKDYAWTRQEYKQLCHIPF